MTNRDVKSSQAPDPVGLYPHAKWAGPFLFLSGVGPRQAGKREIPGVTLDDKGNILAHDIEKQCRSVFENVKTILKEAGAAWEDLIDVTVYLTDIKKDFPAYNRLWAEYFHEGKTCRTTVEVNALPTPIAIELKCVAYVSRSHAPGGKS